MAAQTTYAKRINRVVDHIDAQLASPLNLTALAALAHFSPWHFHRIFQAMTGEIVAERVRRRRLEVAAQRLLATPPAPITSVAFELALLQSRCSAAPFAATSA